MLNYELLKNENPNLSNSPLTNSISKYIRILAEKQIEQQKQRNLLKNEPFTAKQYNFSLR